MDDGRTQSDGNSSHGLRQGELKTSFDAFKGNNSNKKSSYNYDLYRTFQGKKESHIYFPMSLMVFGMYVEIW